VPAPLDCALRLLGFRSFLGRIVSLLGLSRRLPSARPEAERSWLPMVDCGTEGTVSVSTVMLRKGGWVADRVDSDDRDGFDVTWVGLWADAERCSCILPVLVCEEVDEEMKLR
jgi:hypothetical protein